MTPSGTATRERSGPAVDPRIRQRRAAVRRRAGRRRLYWVVAGVVTVAVVAGVVALLHTQLLASRVVTVTGSHPHTPTAAIVTAAGLDHREPLIDLDPGAAAARIERLPWVATATVSRSWPDGVRVAVTERVPAAGMAGPGPSWTEVDRTGRSLAVVPGRPALPQLAVVAAAGPVPPVAVGRGLPAGADPGLAVVTSLPPAFAGQVLAVTVEPDTTVRLSLNSGLTVLLGTATDLQEKYEDVAAIIAHGDLRGKKEIDVTVPGSPAVG